jgi:RimJ/RimL family protein N-acetyltransferase
VIETERLILRQPTLADAVPALDLLTDPLAMAWLGGVHPDAEADPEFAVRRWLERWDDNGCGPFSIVRREDGRWLGRAGILVWDTRGDWRHGTLAGSGEHAQPELGWALASEHWGHGYATEAARAVRDWAYAELGPGRLVSVIRPDNIRSQAVAQRLGCSPGETVNLFDGGPHVVWTHPR